MWLFDDLLKKPTANTPSTSGAGDDSSTGTNPPVSDPLAAATAAPIPVIQKSEEISIVTEAPAETAAAMPPPVTVSAIEDSSSIIIGSNPTPAVSTTPESSPIIISTPEVSVFSNVEVTPTSTTAIPTTDVHDVGIITAPVDPIVTIEEHKNPSSIMDLIGWADTPAVVEAPRVEQSISEIIAETPITEVTTIEKPIALEQVGQAPEATITEEVISEGVVEKSEIEEPTPETVVEAPTAIESTITTETPTTIESPILSLASESTETDLVTSTEETYEHPTEFIEASIARIDAMIARIDEIHNTKLAEALGYKAEKEKYTALEEQAYADAEKYVGEKEHALVMRAYFVDQGKAGGLKSSEPVASVETTLTGLAVQNAVSETVKHEKKSKVKKQEDEVGLLGL